MFQIYGMQLSAPCRLVEMTAEVLVTLLALTQLGPKGASLPMIMVQAASLDVFRLTVTDLTLMR